MTYDREHEKIGFWKTNCSELWERLIDTGAEPPAAAPAPAPALAPAPAPAPASDLDLTPDLAPAPSTLARPKSSAATPAGASPSIILGITCHFP